MNNDLTTLTAVVIIDVGASLAGSGLVTLWYRVTDGEWPDRDTIFGLMKIFFGIGALGIISYLFVKYM